MANAKAVDVSIMGKEFRVSCTDEERPGLINAVNYLDKKMRDIRDTGKVIGAERIAMMAALNMSHELLSTRSGGVEIGDLKRKILDMQEQIDVALSEQNKLF